jgi:hypothetical protein
VDGVHVAAFQSDNNGVSVSYGPDATSLGMLQPFSLDPTAMSMSALFSLVPYASSVTLFGASLSANGTSASLWSGSIGTGAFADLFKVPPPELTKIAGYTSIAGVAGLTQPTTDATTIYTAGATQSGTAVNFSWFKSDGTPIVLEQQVYQTSNANVTAALGGSFSALSQIAVWIENDGAMPPTYTVRAQRLICSM